MDPFEKIANVKQKIQIREEFPVNQQQLVFGGKQLANFRSVSHYGIRAGSTLHLVLIPGRFPIQILVESQTGKRFTLEVDTTDSIEIVKDKILDTEGIPFDHQKLTFA